MFSCHIFVELKSPCSSSLKEPSSVKRPTVHIQPKLLTRNIMGLVIGGLPGPELFPSRISFQLHWRHCFVDRFQHQVDTKESQNVVFEIGKTSLERNKPFSWYFLDISTLFALQNAQISFLLVNQVRNKLQQSILLL